MKDFEYGLMCIISIEVLRAMLDINVTININNEFQVECIKLINLEDFTVSNVVLMPSVEKLVYSREGWFC